MPMHDVAPAMTQALPKILLTSAIHPHWHEVLARQTEVVVAPDSAPDTLARLVQDADGLIVRNQLPPDVFAHAPRLRAVVRHGVGLDMIPVEAATARGIPVANLPGANTSAVVEYALAAMLHLRRGLAAMDSGLRQQGWASARARADHAGELAGSVCGIVGLGAIGSRLATVAQGLGMRVLGLTRRAHSLPAGVVPADRATLFAQSDVVVLCCPLNEQTRGMVSAALLATMQPHACLINVARGPVVDAEAIVHALRAGRLGGAALDVHAQQPLTGHEPVFDCPNLLLTPHVAGVTAPSMRDMSRQAVQTLLALLRSEQPGNVVNPQVFAAASPN